MLCTPALLTAACTSTSIGAYRTQNLATNHHLLLHLILYHEFLQNSQLPPQFFRYSATYNLLNLAYASDPLPKPFFMIFLTIYSPNSVDFVDISTSRFPHITLSSAALNEFSPWLLGCDCSLVLLFHCTFSLSYNGPQPYSTSLYYQPFPNIYILITFFSLSITQPHTIDNLISHRD